jgi:hypothetical protein
MDPGQFLGLFRILQIGCGVAVAIRFRGSRAARLGGLSAALFLLGSLLSSIGMRFGWPIWSFIRFIHIAAYGCLLVSIFTIPVSATSAGSAATAARRDESSKKSSGLQDQHQAAKKVGMQPSAGSAKPGKPERQTVPPPGLSKAGWKPKTPEAKLVALGGMLGTLQLTVMSGQLEQVDRKALEEAYNTVRRYADQLDLTDKLGGDYDRIREVVESTRPDRDKGLLETGELIVAFAYPDNTPSIEDIRKLEWGMKTLGIDRAGDIVSPLRDAISNETTDHNTMAVAVNDVLGGTINFFNATGGSEEKDDDGLEDLTMGDVLFTVLKEHSPAANKAEYSSLKACCMMMGFWTGQMLIVANSIEDGDLDFISDLLGGFAEQAMPYIEKTGIELDVITHGYNAIAEAIEKKYSTMEAEASWVGYLLAGVGNPDRRFRAPQHFNMLRSRVKDIGIDVGPQLKMLESALKKPGDEQVSSVVSQAAGILLISIADALDK